MRDPARIDRVLAKIEEAWKRHPDMRLGQLVMLLAGDADLWQIEDEDLVGGIGRRPGANDP